MEDALLQAWVGWKAKVLQPEGAWALELPPQGRAPSTKAERAPKVFGHCSWAQAGIPEAVLSRPRCGAP